MKMINGLKFTLVGFIECDPLSPDSVLAATKGLEAAVEVVNCHGRLLSKKGEFVRMRAVETLVAEPAAPEQQRAIHPVQGVDPAEQAALMRAMK